MCSCTKSLHKLDQKKCKLLVNINNCMLYYYSDQQIPPEPTYELVTKFTDDKLNDNLIVDNNVNMENNPAYTATDTQDNPPDHHYDFIPASDNVKTKKK